MLQVDLVHPPIQLIPFEGLVEMPQHAFLENLPSLHGSAYEGPPVLCRAVAVAPDQAHLGPAVDLPPRQHVDAGNGHQLLHQPLHRTISRREIRGNVVEVQVGAAVEDGAGDGDADGAAQIAHHVE